MQICQSRAAPRRSAGWGLGIQLPAVDCVELVEGGGRIGSAELRGVGRTEHPQTTARL